VRPRLALVEEGLDPSATIGLPRFPVRHLQADTRRSMLARASRVPRASCRRPRCRIAGSRFCRWAQRFSRSTSTRPWSTRSARSDGSASASRSRTTSTGRPIIGVSLELKSTTRSKSGSRRSTSRSTSLVGVSAPVAADPNNTARRTFCSVRRAARKAESNHHERRIYRRSFSDSAKVLGVGLAARSVPLLTARRAAFGAQIGSE